MKKILLFDFDGTIADSFPSFLEILKKFAVQYKLPPISREELEKLRLEEPKAIIKRLKIPFYKIPLMAREMKKQQLQNIQHIKPFAGLPAVLQQLQERGYKLGIITSNAKENVELFLKNNDIDNFEYLHSDTSIFGKGTVIKNFLKRNRVKKDDVIYIGDEIRDIQACHKVGIQIISVTWGFNAKEGLLKYDPDFIIDTPADLLQIV